MTDEEYKKQAKELDTLIRELCEKYPDLHILMLVKDDEHRRSIIGNYCLPCAAVQLAEFIVDNNIGHNKRGLAATPQNPSYRKH